MLKNKYNFTGVLIQRITYRDLSKKINKWLLDKHSPSKHIACINAYNCSLSIKNKLLRKIYNCADICGPDGMPFVYLIKLLSRSNCDRFAAPDLWLYLFNEAKIKKYTFYFYGADSVTLNNLITNLKIKFPYLRIVGSYAPPFRELSDYEKNAIVKKINSIKPDFLMVGLGTPKQDYWIYENKSIILGTIMIASGATFDFFGGRIKFAPNFIRKSGFEWLYRLFSKDFKRLFKRYTFHYLIFILFFILQKLRFVNFDVQKKDF